MCDNYYLTMYSTLSVSAFTFQCGPTLAIRLAVWSSRVMEKSLKQFLARRSQNANFSLVLQAVSSSQVIVREDSDKTVNSVLSGGLEKVYQKFLRPRMHPRVKSMPLQ